MDFENGFFTADYRDGRVYFDGKNYPAGVFAAHLLNRFYANDTAARLAVFCDGVNCRVPDQLRRGYLIIDDLIKVGRNTLEQLKALPALRPFDGIGVDALRERVSELFTDETGELICAYFRERGRLGALGQAELAVGGGRIDKARFAEAEARIAEITRILSFFDHLSDDMILAHKKLTAFVKRLPEAERYDEIHLLPIALDVFGSTPFPVTSEYIPIRKNKASAGETVARRLRFERYYGFILTDFFEGLHHGHYPRRCPICGKYFLMQSARKQLYCSYGTAPEPYRGKPITCRKYAAVIHRKERADADPITALYDNRCSAIRSEKSRGRITPEFAKKAKALALDHKYRAHSDDEYARKQYKADMTREKLYADAKT